jgi:hypothetical protein
MCCERFIYSQDRSTYFPEQNRQNNPGIYKSLTIYECRTWETEHYNSVLEITVSFLGINKLILDSTGPSFAV